MTQDYTCARCIKAIPTFETHLRFDIQMLITGTGKAAWTSKRYCDPCCQDPEMAVLFADVLLHGVKEIRIIKVWG